MLRHNTGKLREPMHPPDPLAQQVVDGHGYARMSADFASIVFDVLPTILPDHAAEKSAEQPNWALDQRPKVFPHRTRTRMTGRQQPCMFNCL